MEIYLKHRNRKQLICIQSHDKGSIELEIYSSMRDYDLSYNVYDDETTQERLNWYNAQRDSTWVNGKYFPVKAWEKSNKSEFMEAYKNAKNTIKTFADKLIMK